jgi:hypothetical protein
MKKMSLAFLILNLFLFVEAFGQTNSNIEIPQQFSRQFKLDSEKYLDSTNPSEALAGSAFNFWKAASKGQIKGYNLDSLFEIFQNLKQKALLKSVIFLNKTHIVMPHFITSANKC